MRKTRRQPTPPAQRAPAPPPPPPPVPREPWAPPVVDLNGTFGGCRPVVLTLSQILRSDQVYHLPPWQRGQVWTEAQQVAFCETLWNGLPVAPLLVWTRGKRDAEGREHHIVLDGQQRLCTLGAQVHRHDGTPCTPTRAVLDLETGRWSVGEPDGRQIVTARQASNVFETTRSMWSEIRSDEGLWRLIQLMGDAENRIGQNGRLVVYAIGNDADPDAAVAIFRSWNVPGVPIPPDEVEALIRAADLSWTPATS